MALDPKQDMTRKADISILNRVLYDEVPRIKDIVTGARLTLAIIGALEELEDAMPRS